MTTYPELPITLRPSRARAALLLGGSSLFVAGGVWMAHAGSLAGYFVTGVFSLATLVFAIQMHPRAMSLTLTAEGFVMGSLFRTHSYQWQDVGQISVRHMGLHRMVGFNFAPHYAAQARIRAVSNSLAGFDGALPCSYGLSLQELAELMETLRRRACS
jgi:hypothetical protein